MYKVEIKKSKRRSNSSKVLLSLFFILLLFLVAYSLINHSLSVDIKEIESLEATKQEYFVVQKSFNTFENSVTLQELKDGKVACFEEDAENVKELTDSENLIIIKGEDIYEWSKSQESSSYIIVQPQVADYRLKTLAVENVNLWDEDIDNYPLVREETVQVTPQDSEEFSSSNFDKSSITTYVAAGEIIPSRAVARKFRRTGDYKFPFYKVEDLFWEADVSSAVLENAMLGMPEPCHGCTWFTSDEAFMEGLEYLKVDVLTPGNHFRDGGGDAVARTIELLDASNILHSGFSITNWDDAASPAVYEVDGFKFAFLGYDDVAWFHWAGPTWGGVATVSQRFENGTKELLTERIQSNIERARQVADYVIIVMSWGDREYINWPLEYQKLMGHTFIDSGADLVIGTHQHWVNTVEIYNGKFIFYGMGNFVFDQTHTDPTRQGAILKFYFFDKRLVSVKIIPHQTCGPQQSLVDDENCNHFQPQILEEDDPVYRQIWDRIFEYAEI